MTLNYSTGQIVIEDLTLFPNMSFEDFEKINKNYEFEKMLHNNEWKLYRPSKSFRELAVWFHFFKDTLKAAFISYYYPFNTEPYEINQQMIDFMQEKLNNLGGERSATWGGVELSIDRKGGEVSIVVSYS